MRGISGGQRKRTSIAMELAWAPPEIPPEKSRKEMADVPSAHGLSIGTWGQPTMDDQHYSIKIALGFEINVLRLI